MPADGHTSADRLREARGKAERLLSVRDRSTGELRRRLAHAGFDETVVERVIGEAQATGLLDDARFTRLYVAGKKRSGWGRVRIEKELARYGIELRRCDGYPGEFFTDEDELERAQVCLERLRSRAKNQRAAQYHHLMAKGFSAETTHRALRLQPATTLL
jgi:regulatory protein